MPRKRAKQRRSGPTEGKPDATMPKERKALKSRPARPKMTPARKSAEKQDCTLLLPGCPNATETTVLAHLRMFGDGGTGLKPPDHIAVYSDMHCHDMIDGRAVCPVAEPELYEYLIRALIRTHRIMRAKGILMMKGEE